MPEDRELVVSYEHCRRLARAAARNFYYGFALLPPAKRDALCALYAFMRHADDISDSDSAIKDKTEGLKAWRDALDRALGGEDGGRRIIPAVHHTMQDFRNSAGLLPHLMSGAEIDLT